MKMPRMLVVGDKEMSAGEGGELTVRVRGEADQKTQTKEVFIEECLEMIRARAA